MSKPSDLFDYLAQLEAHFEEREPDVLAFVPEVGRFERLRREAGALLARYPDPAGRPALFGVPIGVKDIFHVDGFVTRAGSNVPAGAIQGRESVAVSQLKAQGALIMGKTVTTEFAYFAPGPTRNPHNPAHTPGGSSSGSAAAVGAGLCPLAFGTQTIGSITRPGAFCGTASYKPSYDRISRAGVIPLSPSVDHIGLFAPDVAGLIVPASLLAGGWQTPPLLAQPILGIPEGDYLASAGDEGLAHFRATCARLAQAGYTVKSVPAMPDFADIVARHQKLVAADTTQVHAQWHKAHGDAYHPKTTALIEAGKGVPAGVVEQVRAGRATLRNELMALMDEQGIDVWLSPPAPGTAPAGLDSTGNPIMNLPWTHSGLPTVGVPAGHGQNGLPLGLQLAGRWYTDETLLTWAKGIEYTLANG